MTAPAHGESEYNVVVPTPVNSTASSLEYTAYMHWVPSTASDFATFRLYRGTDAGFVPGPGNLVTATIDTGYVDAGPAGS